MAKAYKIKDPPVKCQLYSLTRWERKSLPIISKITYDDIIHKILPLKLNRYLVFIKFPNYSEKASLKNYAISAILSRHTWVTAVCQLTRNLIVTIDFIPIITSHQMIKIIQQTPQSLLPCI